MSELKAGYVMQTFGNGDKSGPYILKEKDFNTLGVGDDYWQCKVNLFNLDRTWSHVAHYKTLENVEFSE